MYFRNANLGEPVINGPVIAPYRPPFPNIQGKMPALYPQALAALDAMAKLAWFKDVYLPLAAATANAHLALDQAEQVVVVPDEDSTAALLGPKLVQAVLKQTGKSFIKHVLNADLARALSIVDYLFKLRAALSTYDAKRLVNEQRLSRSEEAYRYKLRFFIGLYIAKVSPQSDRVLQASRIEQAFFQYRAALSELWKYEAIERNLASGLPPNTREPPRMYAR